MSDTELIGTGAVARIFEVSDQTIKRWVIAGHLPVARVLPSGQRRFDRAEMERIASNMAVAS